MKIFSVPNFVSFLRLPLLMLTLFFLDSDLKYVFFGLAVASDFFDGFLARALDEKSRLGAIVDPFFDRVFAIILFVVLFLRLELHSYYVVLFFVRDIFTVIGGIVLSTLKSTKKLILKARYSGKFVTVLQLLTLFLMLYGEVEYAKWGILCVFVFSLISIFDYVIFYYKTYHRTSLRPRV